MTSDNLVEFKPKPTHAILRVLHFWRAFDGNADKIAKEMSISRYGVYSTYKRIREHYGCSEISDALEQARVLGHLSESDHVLALQQIVRSLLCHDPDSEILLNEYYTRYGRGMLGVTRATL